MNLSMAFVEQLDQPTREALERLVAEIATGWAVEHNPDGTSKKKGGTGDVVGPASATNLRIAVFDGTTGKLIADGGTTIAALAALAGGVSAHHVTHEPGGTDPLTVDAVAATGSLRTLGPGAQQAAPGNDSRLTNARPPTAHHTTHEPGGSDVLTFAAWTNVANTFTEIQRITRSIPRLLLSDTGQPANARLFDLVNVAQTLYFRSMADDEATAIGVPPPLALTRPGDAYVGRDLYEKARTTAIGHGINTPYNASHYGAVAPLVWTVTSGQVVTNRYSLVGKTLTWMVRLDTTTLSGSAGYEIRVVLPNAMTSAASSGATGMVYMLGAWVPILVEAAAGLTYVALYLSGSPNYALGTLSVRFTIQLEVV